MPAYDATKPNVIYPGDSFLFWNAEAPATGAASASVALAGPNQADNAPTISVELSFTADPGTFEVDFQTSDTDADANYIQEASPNPTKIVNASGVTVYRAEFSTPIKARFFRLLMKTAPANNVKTTAKGSR